MSTETKIRGLVYMDELSASRLLLCIAILVVTYKLLTKIFRKEKPRLPPGPCGLPLVGNLPFLRRDLHSYFAELSKKYGPIMKLQLGSKLCIVVSSPTLAKEVLKDQDAVFANRDVPAVGFTGSYGGVDMIWSPYGDHWRMLRKVCVQELFSNSRLEAFYSLRQRVVRQMVSEVYRNKGKPIDIGERVVLMMFDLIASMLWGGTLEGEERQRISTEFRQVMEQLLGLLGKPNISDIFPVLGVFDLQGMERKMKKLILWFDQIFDDLIDKRAKMEAKMEEEAEEKSNDKEKKDFLQVLLEFTNRGEQKVPFTITHMKALFLDMMVAGTKTSAITVEWAIAELLKKPVEMKKVQQELAAVVGLHNIVEEFHLSKLHLVNAVVKEVLRLHPTAPLLVPRCPSESCTVGGYTVPKGTKVFVNAWALQRDPEVWDQPLEFKPERFLNSDTERDDDGKKFSYIPFGSGRRICVGIPMAETMVPYILASLIHSFNWKLPEGTILDMTETLGIELTKKIPLVAIPTASLSESKLYT